MNIRQRILASGAIGIVAVVLLGGVGFWGQLRLGKASCIMSPSMWLRSALTLSSFSDLSLIHI